MQPAKTLVATVQPSDLTVGAVEAKDGFLENVPLSWLHQCLECQSFSRPYISRVLLKSSKCLARRILEMEPNVTLHLGTMKNEQLTPERAQIRRGVIRDLLGTRQVLQLEILPEAWQCFPAQLADRVTVLKIIYHGITDEDTQAAAGCPWEAMTKLHTVQFHCTDYFMPPVPDLAEVNALCDAVQAGHLQQLRSLHLPLYDQILEERLAPVLGPQLEEVTCSCGLLITHINQLTMLKRITARGCILTEGMVQQLCEHPTLQHVTVQECSVTGDFHQHSCKWETLTMLNADLQALVQLPLSGLQQIRLIGKWCAGWMGDIQAVDDRLGPHLHKMLCLPSEYSSTFTIGVPCGVMAGLIKHMHGVHRLVLTSYIEHHVIPQLWQSLPATVTSLDLEFTLRGGWSNALWLGVPQHLTSICLTVRALWAMDLSTMIENTPAHVQAMVLTVRMCEFFTVLKSQVSSDIAGLHAAAPQHLKLQIRH